MEMKGKIFTLSSLALLLSFLLTGCEGINNDIIVDWSPVELYIYATGNDGESIIRPDMPGMTLTFRGETYTVKDWNERYDRIVGSHRYPHNDSIMTTKAYLAVLYGLFAQPYTEGNDETQYRLYFGEIDGAEDMDEDIILKWPDGSTDTIHYHCSDHREGRNPKCDRSWKLNGNKHQGNIFNFSGKGLGPGLSIR